MKAYCEELFCHIFDNENLDGESHRHIFACNSSDSVFLHLIRHLQKNDNNILALLSSQNNDLFLRYFKTNLESLVDAHLSSFATKKNPDIPDLFWKDHIVSTFVETVKWWINHGMQESPEQITEYFFMVV